jgi:hypothetical protein
MGCTRPVHTQPLVHPINALDHWNALGERLAVVTTLVGKIREALPDHHDDAVTGNPGEPVRPVPAPNPDDRHSTNVRVIDSYEPVMQAVQNSGRFVAADLGTYTLDTAGTVDACLCYGAAISVAAGYADASGKPTVALTGDAALLHSGVVGLLDALWRGSSTTVIIIDNAAAASTGGQVTGTLDRLSCDWMCEMRPDPTEITARLKARTPQVLRMKM